jgi:hypothetical protein
MVYHRKPTRRHRSPSEYHDGVVNFDRYTVMKNCVAFRRGEGKHLALPITQPEPRMHHFL